MTKKTENLKIPVDSVPEDQDIIHSIKELGEHKEFVNYRNSDKNKIIKYIVYAYDTNSICVKDNPNDIKKRKEASATRAGFNRNDKGEFSSKITHIINMEDQDVNKLICCYLRYFVNNKVWNLIVVYEQMLYEYTTLLLDPVSNEGDKRTLEAANIKAKLREECKVIVNDLKSLYKDLYGDNEDIKEEIMVPVRPETMGGALNRV